MVPEINQVKWPGWETHNMIGQGSFGAVYEIQRDVFGETERAALKVISIPQSKSELDEMYSEGYDEDSIQMNLDSQLKAIVSEYSMMRKLNGCSNVVHCDDVRYEKKSDGIGWNIYIKMELLTPLSKVLPTSITDETVIRIGKDICNALERCNMFGIVHRDIKPQNLFVSETGEFKLGDFGIAKTIEKTTGGTKIGTFKYMAPEVYHSQPYGSSADIYSLGLVLYWLLNERRMPFVPLPPAPVLAGVDGEAGNKRLMGAPIPAPKSGSTELKRIVLKACAYHPKDRFINAAEMRQALERLITPAVSPIPNPGTLSQADEKTIRVRAPETVPVGNSIASNTEKIQQPSQISTNAPIEKKEKRRDPGTLFAILAILLASITIAGIILAFSSIAKSNKPEITSATQPELSTALKVGDYITFGSYEQDNNLENGKEDIEWIVLDVKDGAALLISKYVLDFQSYNTANVDVTWETSSIRKWLNQEFINSAFTAEEQTRIVTTNVSASPNPDYDTSPGNTTYDKLFLLSIDEFNEYLSTDNTQNHPASDYSASKGITFSNEECWWWLRTPGDYQNTACFVDEISTVVHGGNYVNINMIAVRPVLWISLENGIMSNDDQKNDTVNNPQAEQTRLLDSITVTDSSGRTLDSYSFFYDHNQNLIRITQKSNWSHVDVAYTDMQETYYSMFYYDTNGMLVKKTFETFSFGSISEYQYDSNGLLVQEVVDPIQSFPSVIRYEYDAQGNCIKETEENTINISTIEYIYDEEGNLTKGISTTQGINSDLYSVNEFYYSYDSEGRLVSLIQRPDADYSTAFYKRKPFDVEEFVFITDGDFNSDDLILRNDAGIDLFRLTVDNPEYITDSSGYLVSIKDTTQQYMGDVVYTFTYK